MSKFFKDNFVYDSNVNIEKFFLYDVSKKQGGKKDNEILKALEPFIKEPKKELWKEVRKRPSFSKYPYEIDLLYISNLKEIRNFNHGIINSDVRFDKVEEIYKTRKIIIENEAQLNKFIHGLHTNDSYDSYTWQICMLLSDRIHKYNQVWEGVF